MLCHIEYNISSFLNPRICVTVNLIKVIKKRFAVMENSQETLDTTPSKYPKLHPFEAAIYIVIFPLGFLYLFYCFLLFIGLKPTNKRKGHVSPAPKPYKHGDYYSNGYFDPAAYRPGTVLWKFTHRK